MLRYGAAVSSEECVQRSQFHRYGGDSLINYSAFGRALAWPLITWGSMVLLATIGGQPGVVCVTPMAWLLSLWSGGRYALWTAGQPARRTLIGTALVGAVLGACLGVLFAVGAAQMGIDTTNTDEVSRALGLTAFMFVAGVMVCPALSIFTGWLTIRRLEKA